MFGIGGIEFLVIAILAVLVIGPSELPRVLYNLGKGMRKMREVSRSVHDAFDTVTHQVELEDIISKSNLPGGDDLDFHAEQQLALEQRRAAAKKKSNKKQSTKSKTSLKKASSAGKKSSTAGSRKAAKTTKVKAERTATRKPKTLSSTTKRSRVSAPDTKGDKA